MLLDTVQMLLGTAEDIPGYSRGCLSPLFVTKTLYANVLNVYVIHKGLTSLVGFIVLKCFNPKLRTGFGGDFNFYLCRVALQNKSTLHQTKIARGR